MSDWYYRNGKRIPGTNAAPGSETWLKAYGEIEGLLTDKDYKIVKQEFTPDGKFWVSTVWLGLNHGFHRTARPLIFETMVFEAKFTKEPPSKYFPKGHEYRKDYEQQRYATEAAALKGHKKFLKEYARIEGLGENWKP
jgi:hypothetical protein